MSIDFEKFLELRNRVADEVDLERFTPVINEDETLDLHSKAMPGRWIRVLLMGSTVVFALMRKGTDDWSGRGSHKEEDISDLLKDAMRRIEWS